MDVEGVLWGASAGHTAQLQLFGIARVHHFDAPLHHDALHPGARLCACCTILVFAIFWAGIVV